MQEKVQKHTLYNTEIFGSLEEVGLYLGDRESVVTVGFFDGVHLGHQDLIASLKKTAKERGLASVLVTFTQHPLTVVGNPSIPAPKLLCSPRQKLRFLAETGVDVIVMIDFTMELAKLTGKEFSSLLKRACNASAIVMGYDNNLGSKRFKTKQETEDYIATWEIPVVRHRVLYKDHIEISSSVIRTAVRAGDFEIAESLLGRPYIILGRVGHGDKIGRTISYPTANITVNTDIYQVPASGIFVAEVLHRGQRYGAMAYYGVRPTVTDINEIRLEAYLFDFSGDLYGEEVEVAFLHYLREDMKFKTLSELAEQLRKDEQASRKYLKNRSL